MTSSLVVANSIELLGGGVVSQIPQCAGAMFALMSAGGGFDLSAPQPTADYVANLILDGERPYGRRASNRTITLPVRITTPGIIGAESQALLAAAREVLEQAIDQDHWTLTWTRDPGPGGTPLPLLIDCFRAQPSRPLYDPVAERQGVMRLTLTIPALPYGRSDTQTQVAFTAPAPASPPPPPAPVVLDAFSQISSDRHYQSPRCVVGPYSLCWDPDDDRVGDPGGQSTRFEYSAQLAYAQDLTGYASLQMYLGFGSRWHHCLEYPGHTHGVRVYVTLTDASGHTVTAQRAHLRLPVSPVWTAPAFSKVTMPVPQGVAAFDYTSVVSYSIVIENRHFPRRLSWVTAYVDALTAQPPSVTVTPAVKGQVHTLHGIAGTARAPISVRAVQPPSAGSPTAITAAGVGTYTVPAAVAWLKVETTGGGGPGGSRTTAGVAGGGGAAEYAREDVFPCTPGDQIPYSVAGAATPGNDGAQTVFGPGPAGPLVVLANGGKAAAADSTAGGDGGDGSPNSVHHPGGRGRTASGSVGGGGGSSGGTNSAGLTPTGTTADVRTATGAGTWTCPQGVTQVYAELWGSGGSGATGSGSNNGAAGSGSEYAAGYVPVTPGNTYNYYVAPGGAAVSGSGLNGNDGAASWFTGDGVTVTANGGKKGLSRSYSGGGGAPGTGSSAPVHHDGGAGGGAMPYSGGGGSSAGPNAAGNPGDGYGGAGTAPTDGGAGGRGSGATGNNGTAGAQPGGGGGGCYSSTTSGKGGDGKLRLTYPGGAPTRYGAAAVTGGGAGGDGGGSPGQAGTAGQQPGGGGGGANSGSGAVAGGNGGAGKIIVTPYGSQPWKNLLLHRPPAGAPRTLQPLVPVGGGADIPDGTLQYNVPQPLTGVNASFAGTYTVYLSAASWSGGSGSTTPRTITVTVYQYEYAGGPSYSVSTVPASVVPAQVVNGLACAGVITLPVRQVSPENTSCYYALAVADSQTADRFRDCLLLDTQGQLAVINLASGGYVTFWADAPDPDAGLGLLLGSQAGREQAAGVVTADTVLSGGPLHVEPSEPDNLLLAYSADASAPAIAVSYHPAWHLDRLY